MYAEVLMETRYEHITLNEDRVPEIAGTTMKVVELVVEQQAYGWSPEELHFQHPYLTLGQVHSALAYYWDHREELDLDIRRSLERSEELRSENQLSELVERLDGIYGAESDGLDADIARLQARSVPDDGW
jgi:uncharacterized protein (DUF433 family)